MEKISFNDIYVEQVLQAVKDVVENRISLDDEIDKEECCDITVKSRTERVDEIMREVIRDILVDSNSSTTDNFKYNYILFADGDNKECERQIKCSLALYYTALYFDNLELLQNMIREGIDFGNEPSDLLLGVLDKDLSYLFENEEYYELIRTRREIFKRFCISLSSDSSKEKRKYYNKFATIMKKREDKFFGVDEWCFKKNTLDIIDEETYLKANKSQFNSFISSIVPPHDEKTIIKLNSLIQNTDFSVQYYTDFPFILNLFSEEELQKYRINGTSSTFFVNAYYAGSDMERVKKIFMKNPSINDRVFYIYPDLLKLFDDDTLSSLDSEKRMQLAYESHGELTSEKEAKIRRIVEEEKKTGVLTKLFKKKINTNSTN